MSEEINTNDDINIKQTSFPFFSLTLIFTLILCLIFPSRLKLNKKFYILGIAVSAFFMNLLFSYFKVLYYDNSWYTQEYQYNKSHAYDQGYREIIYDNQKDIDKSVSGSIYDAVKNAFIYIGKGIKFIFYGESKSNYVPMRKKYS